MKHWTLLVVAAALCVCSLPASAGIIFDDFAAGDTYNCCVGWTVSGPSSLPGQFISANQFVVGGGGGLVTEIDLGVSVVTGTGNGVVAIYTVDGNGNPGTFLGGGNFTAHQQTGQCCAVETVNIANGPTLTDGVTYYMVLAADDVTWDVWDLNTVGATGIDKFSNDNGNSWFDNGPQTLGTFRIIGGSAVPEPGTLVMLGSGIVALGGVLRRKLNL